MRTGVTSDLWWKNAVIYGVDVKTFQDSDGDGIGDFDGLGERLDYLAELGISCLWLLPIMRSPWRDNGYDVSDYFDVDRRLGTLGDLVELLRAARERGVRVITDLVVNHTSDEHPWFQAARSSRDNPYRDYYVWRDEPQPADPERPANLWEPVDGRGGRDFGAHGSFDPRSTTRSVQMWLSQHHGVLAAAGALAGIAAAVRRVR